MALSGLALLGTAIGSVTAIPIAGALVVRRGSRNIARWTAAGFCLSLLAIPLAHDTATLFAALLFYGAMAGANDVAMNAQAVATENCSARPPSRASTPCSASAASPAPVRALSSRDAACRPPPTWCGPPCCS